jgi:nucleotide-binding universal stress UspA family protein
MIKNVLTFVDGSEASLSWLEKAIAFCRPRGARLHVTVLMERLPLEVRDAYTPEGALDTDFAPLGDDTADVMFPARWISCGVAIEISRVWQPFSELTARASAQARLMDIALIAPLSAWADQLLRRRVIEHIVTDAGTPALIVPEHWNPTSIRTAVLGWNGSAEAGRAARALVPLVEQGGKVDVVVVKNGGGLEGEQSCTDIADHLSNQGLMVEADVRLPDGRDASDILQAFASSHGAELLAIGGYSHSPLTERLFGGVTRDLIAEPHMPVLMVG